MLLAGDEEGMSPTMLRAGLGTHAPSVTHVAYHVRVLAGDGLIKRTRMEPRRGAIEHYYAVTAAGRLAAELIELVDSHPATAAARRRISRRPARR